MLLCNTYGFWSVQHSYAEIPQQQTTVFTNAAEAIVLVVTFPRIEGDGCYPGLMTLAACYDHGICYGPDGDEVVLAAGDDVLAVGGPADTAETTVVARVPI